VTAATADPAPVAAVELRAASLTYPDGTHALRPVDLDVRPGEFITLLGPSGCGKSSLLKMMAGLLQPTQGTLRRWGHPTRDPEAGGRRLAFVFQAPTLMPWARVAANVRLPLDLAGVARAEADARVAEALDRVGLAGAATKLPHTLSGGMQMRVSIARSLVTRPDLLLLDEPFGALDEITRQRLDAELLDLWRERGLTVVFVTHSIHEAVFLSQRVVVMAARPGRILAELPIAEPYPRRAEFSVSMRFSQTARQLQELLLRASGESLDGAAAVARSAD
jgi:NitT/TauT family transport system ATP-binding protein